LLFSIGINDSQFVHSQNDLRISPEKFKENVQKLIELAQKFTQQIIFLGLAPVDESKVDPIPWVPDRSYKNEHIQQFNKIIEAVAKENNIYFVEIFKEWLNSDYKNLLEDGVHPNSEGHQKIFEKVKDILMENKII
jgi:lysophospholipase L1-like esterase